MSQRILIGIPTKDNIEPQTFKSIYNLKLPEGATTYLEYFYGYRVDQVRNLMLEYFVKNEEFTHMLFVDSDMVFCPITLQSFLIYDVPVIGIPYRQKKEELIIEAWKDDGSRLTKSDLNKGLQNIRALGFGCVLVRRDVAEYVVNNHPYPWFEYIQTSTDFKSIVSEDWTFCDKVGKQNIFLDTDNVTAKQVGKIFYGI